MGGWKEWMKGREGRTEGKRDRGREGRVGSFWLSAKVQSTQAGKG